jgi:hypothetical protein
MRTESHSLAITNTSSTLDPPAIRRVDGADALPQ